MKDWRPVDRRYLREFIPAMVAYVLVTIFVWPFVDHVHNVVGRVLLLLLPMVPIGFVARALIHRIRDGDELENRLFLEATAIASITVGMASFFAGFLEAAGVLKLEAGLLYIMPALIAVWGLALAWARRRYRGE